MHDYLDFIQRVETMLNTPDLDPVTYLEFAREEPYSKELSAPYRLDCALTYRLPEGENVHYAPVERVKKELSTEEWKTILSKAWEAGIPHVVFTGGEPTLREDLPALVAHTQAIGQVCGLLSGSLLLASADYLKTILDSGLDHLMFLLQPDREESWTALGKAMASDLSTTAHITLNREFAPRAGSILERLAQMEVRWLSLSASDPAGAEALTALRNRAAELGLSLQWDLPVPYSPANPISQEIGTPSTGAGEGVAVRRTRRRRPSGTGSQPGAGKLPARSLGADLGRRTLEINPTRCETAPLGEKSTPVCRFPSKNGTIDFANKPAGPNPCGRIFFPGPPSAARNASSRSDAGPAR